MTPGKLEWRELESFFHHSRQRASCKDIHIEQLSTKATSGRKPLRSCLSRQRLLLDMLRGFVKMDVREKERRNANQDGDQEVEQETDQDASSSFADAGSALVQCVERFFKNPQQNYEVPLQLLQEWFSDTSTHRRQELAKLFLALLQEQGLDMEQIMGQVLDYSDNCKSNEMFLEVEAADSKKDLEEMESDSQFEGEELAGESVEMRDVSCGDSSSAKPLEWVDTSTGDSASIISDPIILKTLREYRPIPVKTKPETFHEVNRKGRLTKTAHVDVPTGSEEEGMVLTVVGEDDGRTDGFDGVCHSIAQCDYSTSSELGMEYPLVEKTTRSVGTSPFQDGALTAKCVSEPNIQLACLNGRLPTTAMRKSQSLPSVRCCDEPSVPPLAFIELPRNKCFLSKETSTMAVPRTYETPRREAEKPTVISSVVSTAPAPPTYKARTTFVEMSHAEFMKRQMLLNEKVNVRQGFRLSGQILYVPELVSCTAPHVEKPTQPMLLHSNVDVKRSRNPVEIKVAMMGGNEVVENVVVSQTSSSHTIHYTPTHNHIASAPTPSSHLVNDKCSVVYVRESIPHAQPVLVAATPSTPTTTWQEEARKKPIIAYAKRKPNESREKQGIIFGDNMKVLIAPNGIMNSVHETQSMKAAPQIKACERVRDVSDMESGVSVVHATSLSGLTPVGDVVFVKRGMEERRKPVVVIPTEPAPKKPTLPKFNQTFVQNFQPKLLRTAESLSETQPIDYLRKIPKKVITPYSPVTQVGTTIGTEENGSVTHDAGIVTEEPVAVTHTHIQPTSSVIHSVLSASNAPVIVERPVQVKNVTNAQPTQVGLLIYTQGSPEESSPVQTLLLTTLPNGSAYCVRLPPSATLHNANSAVSPQIDSVSRPVVVQTVPHGTPVTIKQTIKKLDAMPVAPPAESNKVALLKDLKEFENVFEETKLKFEKEKQLNVGDAGDALAPVVSIESAACSVQVPPPPRQPSPPVVSLPKFECEKVVVGVKRKPDGDMPVVTRLYTTVKKPLIVVANYGQPPSSQLHARPMLCSTSPPAVTHLPSKSPKGKSRSGKTYPNPAKSPPTAKPQQKPQEDEKTQQKIFAILEEYAVQKEHSPDTNNRPAPRRRSNPPSASASKKKRPLLKSKDASGDSEDGSFSEM